MLRTKAKLPRAGDKEKVELQSTEETMDSTFYVEESNKN